MTQQTKFDALRDELTRQVERLGKESKKHKELFRTLRYIVFGLTACAALLSSAAITFQAQQVWLNLAVVLATVTAGAASSIEGIRKPAELWILERNLYYALKNLKFELEYEFAERGTNLDLDEFFNRMMNMLNASKQKWSQQVTPTDKSVPQQ